MNNPWRNFGRDTLAELLELARETKADAAEARTQRGALSDRFIEGRALAYYDAVSIFIKQLRAFNIPLASVGLSEDFDVERDLL
jgi:hypothetical protein